MPIIHLIRILHQDLYRIGEKLSKRDKLGLHALIETICLEALALAIESALRSKSLKIPTLEKLRIKNEILKNLIRTEHELEIIDQKTYFRLAEQLVKIGKMANGWLSYTQKGAN